MKKTIIAIFALTILFPFISYSQGVNDEEEQSKPMFVGPYLGWSVVGINAASVPAGIKNAVETASSPNFGIMAFFPTTIMDKSGFGAHLGIKQIPYGFDNGFQKNKYTFNYFAIGGFFYLSGFTIGFDGSIPMSATSTTGNTDIDVNTDNLQTSIDFKVGGLFKLYENKSGNLDLFLNAGYFLIEQYKNVTTGNTNPAHIEIGLTYLFNTANF